MYFLTKYIDQTLMFYQPSIMKRAYELRASEEVLARMVFPKIFSTSVIIEGFDGKWEIKQPSIWRAEFGIYKYGYQMSFAKYVSNFWKTRGTIELPKGGRLNCKSGKIRKPLEIFSSSGELILLYENKLSIKGKTTVRIEKRLELLDQYPWIIMMGWYIVLLNKRGRARAAG